ncbi:MAG: SDR family NAD(P)-dependent oxidoreductase, partial [Salinisphaera sp.]|nr:SDR family NAD(P)-dependent oxidoreductase [Salinisphaera sp.]
MKGLTDKAAIVTGGGSGIGRAIARRLAQEGMAVAILDMNRDNAEQVVGEIREAGGRGLAQVCDITDNDQVTASVAAIEQAQGPTWALVNNAGWDSPMPFLKTEPAFWRKIIDLNYLGPLQVTHAVASGMAERASGRIIFIASDAGRVGSTGEVVYSGCKGGTIAFSKALARELARKNVLLNCICPGPTNTPIMDSFAGAGEQGEKLRAARVRA